MSKDFYLSKITCSECGSDVDIEPINGGMRLSCPNSCSEPSIYVRADWEEITKLVVEKFKEGEDKARRRKQ